MAFTNPTNEERRQILEDAKTIAVVGLSNKPERTSYMVSQAMQSKGYKIIPVNPTIEEALGEKAIGSLSELQEPVDIVNVFRRSEEVGPVVEEAIQIKPKVIWMQQGVYNEEAARKAQEAGITVVMDQCIKVDHAILVRK
ncbi:CoA-binding protein [Aneurinibacillus aneurinilyticus]|jgi:predicted CoA-binding protein|uniref:CoA-binding protein n=2 Tax=Aneurinibacillus aneurinilyticus TaxID=1391 RepID=A0A848D5L6_ANEAE|nr:CoA-binding protein [Aneurinibacillus aneurinilyticus]MCI1693490.1 CoA-binding protein [Aneurinibacillus aneurinilyticus]MED0672507.1 CoA-binding protein [Aneurinibacillus aneurinilyticus]MED0704512.1 CoA-binding protein [Aneurinibacillus aneurinilyticus]MED0725180.1 CoA-binding protein [Aneurinibacillus aneurinilyticus]MED0733924.1 CoA-binding protein [Aneurinibacillus aneurinilyticus]